MRVRRPDDEIEWIKICTQFDAVFSGSAVFFPTFSFCYCYVFDKDALRLFISIQVGCARRHERRFSKSDFNCH